MSTLDKALVMIAAHYGEAILFRAKGSEFWASVRDHCPDLSWNWADYEYEIAPGTASVEATITALPSPGAPEGQDSGKPTKADPGAFMSDEELAGYSLKHGDFRRLKALFKEDTK